MTLSLWLLLLAPQLLLLLAPQLLLLLAPRLPKRDSLSNSLLAWGYRGKVEREREKD